MPQFVRLINKGNIPYDFHIHQIKRVIGPGQDAMIPWDVACSLFGDPSSVDTLSDQVRSRAWTQSAQLHNYQVGGMTEDEWQLIRPQIEVWDVETDERIYMVLEDPAGVLGSGNPAATNDDINQSELLKIIRQQQEQINALANLMANGGQAPTQTQGESPLPSQDANGEPDPSLAFGGPILPVFPVEGPAGGDVNNGPSPDGPPAPVEPIALKPSVGGAVPADADPDALAALAQVKEDEPQTPTSGKGKLAPKTS